MCHLLRKYVTESVNSLLENNKKEDINVLYNYYNCVIISHAGAIKNNNVKFKMLHVKNRVTHFPFWWEVQN